MAGFGTPPTSPLPIPGVTIGPQWASMEVTAISELQAIVAPKLTGAQIDLGTDGELKHGPRTVRRGAAAANSALAYSPTGGGVFVGVGATDEVHWSIPLANNDRLLEVSIYGEVALGTAWSLKLFSLNMLTAVLSQIGATVSSSTSPLREKRTLTGLTQTLGTDTIFLIVWTSGAVNNKVRGCEFKFDKIATP